MKNYSRKQLKKDIAAGILVAVIAFPLSVALAIASGLSPEKGLYSAMIGGFFVSLLGGSSVNIGGATAATVMTVFTIVEGFGLSGLAAATIMAGVILMALGFLRAGALLKYIPRTITLGFTAGIAMGIFTGQLKGFFGFEMGAVPVKVLDKLIAYGKVLPTMDMSSVLVGLAALVIVVGTPYISARIPGSLAAIVITTLAVVWGKLEVETIQSVYGTLPAHFPSPSLPQISVEMIENLIPLSVTLAILIAIVSLLSCSVTDGLTGERHNSNQELVGEGIANIFCGLFGAVPVAGAVARASSSVKNGGRTPAAGLVHSIVVTLIVLFLMPMAAYIPIPTLSAILIAVAVNMSSWREFIYMARNAPKSDFIVLMGTFLAGVLSDLLFAVEIGILISAILFMRRMTQVTFIREWKYLEDEADSPHQNQPGLKQVPESTLVYEIEGPAFFATVDGLFSITPTEGTKVLILRMRSVPSIDITALRGMEAFLERCRKDQITLLLSHVMDHPYQVMKKAGFVEKLGAEGFCANIDEALEKAREIIANHG